MENEDKVIECPCCENGSAYKEWYKISSDDYAICPVCDNACTYDEFPEGSF